MPKDQNVLADWISDHSNELKKIITKKTNLPDKVTELARRPNKVGVAESIVIGMTYDVVLASLGLPNKVLVEGGGSGPPELPIAWLIYQLEDSENDLVITVQLQDDLDTIKVIHKNLKKD